MTEILRCPLMPEVEPVCAIAGPLGQSIWIEAKEGSRGWYVRGPTMPTEAEAIRVWNDAMRKLGAKEGEG